MYDLTKGRKSGKTMDKEGYSLCLRISWVVLMVGQVVISRGCLSGGFIL